MKADTVGPLSIKKEGRGRLKHILPQLVPGIGFGEDAFGQAFGTVAAIRLLDYLEHQFTHTYMIRHVFAGSGGRATRLPRITPDESLAPAGLTLPAFRLMGHRPFDARLAGRPLRCAAAGQASPWAFTFAHLDQFQVAGHTAKWIARTRALWDDLSSPPSFPGKRSPRQAARIMGFASYSLNGVSFEEAATVFGDPLGRVVADPRHSSDEERMVLSGLFPNRHLLAVMFAGSRRGNSDRSATAGTRRERKEYGRPPTKREIKKRISGDEILPEYDFSKAIPNNKRCPVCSRKFFRRTEPDVAAAFPTSREANEALRALAALIQKHRTRKQRTGDNS